MLSRTRIGLVLIVLVICSPALAEPPKHLLLLGQTRDDHPAGAHEFMAGVQLMAQLLKGVPGLDIQIIRADEPWREGPDLLQKADGVVLYLSEGARWVANDSQRKAAFTKLARRGGGFVALHWAMGTKDAGPIEGYQRLLGGCHGGPDRKYKEGTFEVQVVSESPIVAGIAPFRVTDEFYYRLKFVPPAGSVKPVLRVPVDGQLETVAWSWERPDGGRSFGCSGLHFNDNWRLPEYRRLVAQAVLWSLKLPIPKDGLPVEISLNQR